MIRLSNHRYLLLVALAGLATAAETISGPIAGYSADPSGRQLRAILGVPGALAFSDPLLLPEGITQLRLAPGQDFALAERADAAPAILFLSNGTVERLAPIEDGMPASDWVAFSPGASAAILFSAGANRLQVLTGLPNAPHVAMDIEATSLSVQPGLGAVSDDGTLVLLASETSVYRVSKTGAAQLVLSAGGVRSIAILRNGADAAISDSSTGSVHILRNAASAVETSILASGLDGIGAIFPAWDGRSLFVARPGAETLSSVDLESGAVESFASAAAPVGLVPLRNHDTFLISARPRQPGWVFYRDGAAGRIVFIPAAKTSREIPVREGVR